MSKTHDNLMLAAKGEAFARLKYIAFSHQALKEGRADIAQLFEEAAGAETVHGVNHLNSLGFVKSTKENLLSGTTGEQEEIENMYPKMIEEAKADKEITEEERALAISAFEVAMQREKAHDAMFSAALNSI